MAKRKPKRTHAPRVKVSHDRLVDLARNAVVHENPYFPIETKEACYILGLALSTFNDAGTSGADLDDELCQIDDLLEGAGYKLGRGGTVAALKLVIAHAKRRALVTRPRCLRTTKRPKPKSRRLKK